MNLKNRVPERVFVVSDIHMGPGNELAIFLDHDRLAAFVRFAAQGEPCTLVLGGDVLDFLQVEGYAGPVPGRAVAYLDDLLENRGSGGKQYPQKTQIVLDALGDFLSAGHDLVWCAGNHDPEISFDSVQQRLIERLGPAHVRRVHFHASRDPVQLRVGSSEVWISHGDQADSSNRIDWESLAAAARAGRPWTLPPGSTFVLAHLNVVKQRLPFVDIITTDCVRTALLLLYIDAKTFRSQVSGAACLGVSTMLQSLRNRLAKLFRGPSLGAPAVPVDEGPTLEDRMAALLFEQLKGRPAAECTTIVEDLENDLLHASTPRPGPGSGSLAAHGGAMAWLMRAYIAAPATFASDADTAAAQLGEYCGSAASVPDVYICGHTHHRLDTCVRVHDRTVRFLNTGSWVRSIRPPTDLAVIESWIDRVEGAGLSPERDFPYERAEFPVACLEPTAGGAHVRLQLWDGTSLVPAS